MSPKQTAAEARKARMARAASRRIEPDAAPAGRTAIRSKPVRITLDLDPEVYRALQEWTAKAARDLDVPKVTNAQALRAMISATAKDDADVLDVLRETK